MFIKPYSYCAEGKGLCLLNSKGACSCCGGVCRSYPEFMRSFSLCLKEMQRLVKRFPVDLSWLATRAETEWGIDLEAVLGEANTRISLPESDFFMPSQLPKLDFIAVALIHTGSRERVVIHDDHFDAKFYWHSTRYAPVSMTYATTTGLNELVFECDTANRKHGLLYSDLQVYLHLLSAQNRLWYAMLAEGHYLMPDDLLGLGRLI